MSQTMDFHRFSGDLTSFLTKTFPTYPSESIGTLTEYACVLIQMNRGPEDIKTELLDVTGPEEARVISEWIVKYMESDGTTLDHGDMVINLDMRSDDDMDEDDGDRHPRRGSSSRGGNPAHLLSRAVQEATETHSLNTRKRPHATSSSPSTEENGRKHPRISPSLQQEDVTFTVTVSSTAPLGSTSSITTKPPRCTFWPNCKNGSTCPFWHPKEPCPHLSTCTKGNQCMYIHPPEQYTVPCRFGVNCTRPGCVYAHPHPNGASSTSRVKCRFWPGCKNLVCPFWHPDSSTGASNRGMVMSSSVPGGQRKQKRDEICKFEPFCTRPDCIYTHPSKDEKPGETVMVDGETLPKSKKFVEPIEKDPTTLPPVFGVRKGNGMWKPRVAVFNQTNGKDGHISERKFAVEDGEVEQVGGEEGRVEGEETEVKKEEGGL